MMRRALLVTALVAGVACSSPTTRRVFEGPDLPQLVVTVTTDPPALADGVERDARFRITFDDYPDPETANFGPLLLRSGSGNFDAVLSIDLVGRAILIQPRTLLQPDTTYEVVIDPTVAALSGRVTGRTISNQFTTGGSTANLPAPDPVPWKGDDGVATLLASCQGRCHSVDLPSRRLRLDFVFDSSGNPVGADPNDPAFGIINVPSVGLAGTIDPLPRVQPGNSARSDLLRKVLGGNHQEEPADAPPYPQMRVDGVRMPPGGVYWTDDQSARLQRWIDQGAHPDL